MGFSLRNGTLQFDQNLGYKDRSPTKTEKEVAAWFENEVANDHIKLNLSRTGEIPGTIKKPPFENDIGIFLKNITPEHCRRI